MRRLKKTDILSEQVLNELRATMEAKLASLPAEAFASHAGQESYEAMRAQLREPWEDSKPESPVPMASAFPSENDTHWFGSGGTDPDV